MEFNGLLNAFSRGLIVRVFILCGTAGLYGWTLTFDQLWVTKFLLLAIFVGMIVDMIYFAGNPQQRISFFMESLPFGDDLPVFSLPAKDDTEIIFRRFVEIVRQIKIQKQVEYELFVAATNHLAVAMLVFDRNGSVKLCNKAALQLFRLPSLINIAHIASISRELAETLMQIQTNEQILVKTELAAHPVKLSIRASRARFINETWNIVTLQDIQQEIAQEETEAWQKMIRILAHEIINSTSPINMLTGSLKTIARKENYTEDDRRNLVSGLQAIEKRSRGMTSFVENYRTMTTIPPAVFAETHIGDLLKRLERLFKDECEKKGMSLIITTSGDTLFQTDERLVEQVLINLIRNAIDAADKPSPTILIKTSNDGKDLLIEVADNGCGFAPKNLETVFTPFFTTKETGTGIGLFISRKIIQTLHGTMSIQSEMRKGTTVSLRIPVV